LKKETPEIISEYFQKKKQKKRKRDLPGGGADGSKVFEEKILSTLNQTLAQNFFFKTRQGLTLLAAEPSTYLWASFLDVFVPLAIGAFSSSSTVLLVSRWRAGERWRGAT
jgi:hypothetical protein